MKALLASIVLAVVLCAFATAQNFQTPVQTKGPSTSQLLWRTDVQTDIGLTQSQKSQLDTIRERAAKQANGNFTPGTQNFAPSSVDKWIAWFDQEAERVLTEEQRKRLGEIKLQIRGYTVLFDPEIQKQLEITDDQKNQLAAAAQQRQYEMQQFRERLRSRQNTGQGISADVKRINAQYTAALARVLTQEQSAKLTEMQGKPFKARS